MRSVKIIYTEKINEYKKDIKVLRPAEYVKIIEKEIK